MPTDLLLVQQLVLCVHTLVFAFALVTVVSEGLALLRPTTFDVHALRHSGQYLARLLGLLWITGAGLVSLNPGWEWSAWEAQPKLQAKLTVVLALTLQGLLIQWVALPALRRALDRPPRALTLAVCMLLGVSCTVSWFFACFLGVARFLSSSWRYADFMTLYVEALLIGVVAGWVFVLPPLSHAVRAQTRGMGPRSAKSTFNGKPRRTAA